MNMYSGCVRQRWVDVMVLFPPLATIANHQPISPTHPHPNLIVTKTGNLKYGPTIVVALGVLPFLNFREFSIV
jgi:hypothetical protein